MSKRQGGVALTPPPLAKVAKYRKRARVKCSSLVYCHKLAWRHIQNRCWLVMECRVNVWLQKEHFAKLARCAIHWKVSWRLACMYLWKYHKYLEGVSIFGSHVALFSPLDSIHQFVFMLRIMICGEWSSSAEEAGHIGIEHTGGRQICLCLP